MRSFSLYVTAAVAAFAAVLLLRQVNTASAGRAFEAVRADYRTSLDEAMAESQRTGRPVYALVTADWCGPCQRLKGDVLASDAVSELLREQFVPVYLEESAAASDIAQLPPMLRRAYPTSVVIDDREFIAVLEGNTSSDRFEDFLRQALDKAAEEQPPEDHSADDVQPPAQSGGSSGSQPDDQAQG